MYNRTTYSGSSSASSSGVRTGPVGGATARPAPRAADWAGRGAAAATAAAAAVCCSMVIYLYIYIYYIYISLSLSLYIYIIQVFRDFRTIAKL